MQATSAFSTKNARAFFAIALSAASILVAIASFASDSVLSHVKWCAQPGHTSDHSVAAAYVDAMVDSLESEGWVRLTPDNLSPERLQFASLLFASPVQEDEMAEAQEGWRKAVRFEVFERQAVRPDLFWLLHEEIGAVSSVAVFDNEIERLGLRVTCRTGISKNAATALMTGLAGEPISWEELRAIFLPDGSYQSEIYNITEDFRTPGTKADAKVLISLHPMRTGLHAEKSDDFELVMMIQANSAIYPRNPER